MTQSNNRNFFIRRFHSLVALIPIGIFVIVHMLLNSSVLLSGFESYNVLVNFMKTAPCIVVLEVALIAIPILFHGIYGIYIVYLSKNNALNYKYYRNWAFLLQRVTAIIMTLFLIWHVWTLRLSGHEGAEEVIYTLAGILQNPLLFVLYLIGVISSLYHLGNGLFTFCITWGICQGEQAQKIFSICSILIFLALSALAVIVLINISMIPLP